MSLPLYYDSSDEDQADDLVISESDDTIIVHDPVPEKPCPRKHFVQLAVDKSCSLFAVMNHLYDEFKFVFDLNSVERAKIRDELITDVKTVCVDKSRSKLIEIVVKNCLVD